MFKNLSLTYFENQYDLVIYITNILLLDITEFSIDLQEIEYNSKFLYSFSDNNKGVLEVEVFRNYQGLYKCTFIGVTI